MNAERIFWVVAIGLVLVACGRAPMVASLPIAPARTAAAQPAASAQPNGAATSVPAQPTVTPSPAGGTLVVYHKSGGIMGLNETLTIAADGTLTLDSSLGGVKRAQADPAVLRRLVDLIGSADFATLPPLAETSGADLFVYEISVGGSAQPTVVTMDGVQNPAVLDQALDLLEQLCGMVR